MEFRRLQKLLRHASNYSAGKEVFLQRLPESREEKLWLLMDFAKMEALVIAELLARQEEEAKDEQHDGKQSQGVEETHP